MNHVHALIFGQRNDRINIEVGGNRAFSFAYQVGLIRLKPMYSKTIFFRINRDCSKV